MKNSAKGFCLTTIDRLGKWDGKHFAVYTTKAAAKDAIPFDPLTNKRMKVKIVPCVITY